MRSPCPAQLGIAYLELSRAIGLTGDPLNCEQMVVAAHRAVPNADHVTFAIADARMHPRELASTDPIAVELDEIQRKLAEGPLLGPIATPKVVQIRDLARDDRWPRFARIASRVTGVRSLFAVRTPLTGGRHASFSFCADRSDGFNAEDVATGRVIATMATNCLDRRAAQVKADNLQVALASAETIGTAIGILVAREGITRAEAFARLRTASQNMHRKLHDIAADVCECGVLPDSVMTWTRSA